MTQEEIATWARHHSVRFPSWRRIFESFEENAQEETVAFLKQRLGKVSLDAAIAASDQLYDSDNAPKLEYHVREIEKRAAAIEKREAAERSRAATGMETFKCHYCRDAGLVHVFIGSLPKTIGRPNPVTGEVESIRNINEQMYGPVGLKQPIAIPCFCEDAHPRPSGLPRTVYDKMVLVFGPLTFRTGQRVEVIGFGARRFEQLSDEEQQRVLGLVTPQCHPEGALMGLRGQESHRSPKEG